MINFFRKTRKKLADDNQFFKYTRYAIGEILLVVIGILIALQINNWNEERKTNVDLSNKLESLIDDLKNDKIRLTRGKERLRFKIYALQHLLKLAGKQPVSFKMHLKEGMYVIPYKEVSEFWKGPYPQYENKEFIGKTFLDSCREIFYYNTTAFDELNSSGMFSLIENDTLTKLIRSYYFDFEFNYNQKYMQVLENFREEFKNQGAVYYNTDTLEEPLKLITNEPRFEASMKEVIYESVFIAYLVELWLGEYDFLINRIENEIKKLN